MKPPRRASVSIASCLVVLIACSGADTNPDPIARPSGSPTGFDCPAQETALADPDPLEVDVDGDGTRDRTVIAGAVAGCRTLVIVDTGDRVLTRTVDEDPSGPGLPRIAGSAEVDGRPGSEIIVAIAAGASTEFFGLFSVSQGRLHRIGLSPGPFGDLLPSGGSAGHLDASDCADANRLVISSAVTRQDRFAVVRRFYRREDNRFVRASVDRTRLSPQRLNDLPEFGSTPLGSCPQA